MRTSPTAVRDEPPAVRGEPADRPTDDRAPRRVLPRSWPAALVSMAVVGGLFTMLFLRNHRFAFIDDRQADGVAKLTDMGRILMSGEWPWLSTHVVNSGGYAVEYQNGVFNPVNLAFGVLMAHLDDAAFSSFLQLLAHLLLVTAAAAWLGRMLGLRTWWAVAFAVSVGFQPYTVFWGAGWYQAPVSFSWFVLAVAAAVALHLTGRNRYGWLLLVSVYLVCQSGWPLAIPVLGLFIAVLCGARLVTRQPGGTTAWIAVWSAAGAVISLIGLYPLFLSFEVATRSSSISNASNFNVAPLEGLLHFADPSYESFFYNFDGYVLQPIPSFYVAWFVLPVLVFWRPVATALTPKVRALFITAGGLLLLTAVGALGPERVLVFRFPTRFLEYSGFFLLVTVALLVACGRFTVTRRRLAVFGGLLVLQVVNALQADPDHPARIVGLNALAAVFGLALVGAGLPRPAAGRLRPLARLANGRTQDAVAVVGTVVVLAVVALLHPMGRGYDLGFPSDASRLPVLSERDYTLFYGSYPSLPNAEHLPSPAPQVAGYYAEYHPSSMGLLVGDRTVNGYSPLGDRLLREHVPLSDQGNFDDGGAAQFTQVDPTTGLTWLELLRVDQIIADLGPRDEELKATLDDSWQRVAQGQYTATYRRAAYTLPGLVTYAAPGVAVGSREPCRLQNSHECVAVTATGRAGGRLVFARLWYPGYSATVGGKPVDVVQHAGGLLQVDLPAGAHGELVVSYRSPGFIPLAALGIGVLLALAVAQTVALRRRSRASRTVAEPTPLGIGPSAEGEEPAATVEPLGPPAGCATPS